MHFAYIVSRLYCCFLRRSPNNTARNYFSLSSRGQGSTRHASWSHFHWTHYQNRPKQRMRLLEGQWILPAETTETRRRLLAHRATPGKDVDKLVTISVTSHHIAFLVIFLWNCCITLFVILSIAFEKRKSNLCIPKLLLVFIGIEFCEIGGYHTFVIFQCFQFYEWIRPRY